MCFRRTRCSDGTLAGWGLFYQQVVPMEQKKFGQDIASGMSRGGSRPGSDPLYARLQVLRIYYCYCRCCVYTLLLLQVLHIYFTAAGAAHIPYCCCMSEPDCPVPLLLRLKRLASIFPKL